MKKLTSFLTIMAFLLTISSCKKNEVSNNDVVIPYEPGTNITAPVAGRVIDKNGAPINGVEIKVGSSTTVTDVEGNFIIPSASINQNAGFIKATKSGYFSGSRTIRPKEKTINNVVIQLIEKKESGTFTNASGGTITVATGGSIEFPANAVVTKSGAAYTGTVKVSAYFLDPTSESCNREMPGDLRGINTSNNEQVLTSYGMMNVELNGSNGEALQLASGKKATLTFPVASATQSKAPASIPLWFFDETKGMWVEEGTATKNGNNYVGSVAHFTWWNCDWGGGPLTLKATFVDQTGSPLAGYHVYFITSAGWGGGGGWGITASDGSLTGNIPANEPIIIKVKNWQPCGVGYQTIDSSTVGPFTQNTDLGNVVVTLNNVTTLGLTIKGTAVDCNNNPVAYGYATIKLGTSTMYTQVINGNYSRTKIYCNTVPTGTATVEVTDLSTLKKNTTPATVNITGAGTYTVSPITVCGVQAFIRYTATFIDQNGNLLKRPNYIGFKLSPTSSVTFSDTANLNNGVMIKTLKANTPYTMLFYYYSPCNNSLTPIDSVQMGPFTSDFNAGIITINLPPSSATSVTISGTVTDCNNNNVTNGIATMQVDGNAYSMAITNGVFSQTINRCNASMPTTATITVINSATGQQNATPITATVTNANVNIGIVQACGTSANEFFRDTIGTNIYNLGATDSIMAYFNNGSTYISASSFSPLYSNFNCSFPGNTTGLYWANITFYDNNQAKYITDSNHMVYMSITEYGSVGQYIGGTFNGTLISANSTTTKPISGSFRIKRMQ